jgi:hypothetical protein
MEINIQPLGLSASDQQEIHDGQRQWAMTFRTMRNRVDRTSDSIEQP